MNGSKSLVLCCLSFTIFFVNAAQTKSNSYLIPFLNNGVPNYFVKVDGLKPYVLDQLRIVEYCQRPDITTDFSIFKNHLEVNNELFLVSGYGYWKSNGMIAKMDTTFCSWNILPSSMELPCNGLVIGGTDANNYYLLNAYFVNQFLSEERFIDTIFNLNFQERIWRPIGTYNSKYVDIIKQSKDKIIGSKYLICHHINQFYLFDPSANKIGVLESQKLNDFYNNENKQKIFHINDSMFIYYGIKEDSIFFDTIIVDLKSNLKWSKDSFIVYFKQPIFKLKYLVILFFSTLIFVIFYILFLLKKRKKVLLNLSDDEKSIIHYIIQNDTISTQEINDIINRSKNYNREYLKKIRISTINQINAKFQFCYKMELIQIEKSSQDKRIINYVLSKEVDMEDLKKIIEN